MLSPEQFTGFLLAAVLITASPGPENLMVLVSGHFARAAAGHGLRPGLRPRLPEPHGAGGAGRECADRGLALGFWLAQVCGGLYLLWLGWQALRRPGLSEDRTQRVGAV